jgi:flagellar L-ring protein precursor FlgH
MIVLDETTQGEKSANTEFSKQSEVDIPTPTLGNLNTSEFNANIQGNRSFDGGATSSQANTMSGIISVMVHRVMPNGVLEVRGEKWISLNQGDEFIRVTGFIRSEDIDSENRVLSNRLADARISYAGTGELADANEAGWLSQLINSPWFPL